MYCGQVKHAARLPLHGAALPIFVSHVTYQAQAELGHNCWELTLAVPMLVSKTLMQSLTPEASNLLCHTLTLLLPLCMQEAVGCRLQQ